MTPWWYCIGTDIRVTTGDRKSESVSSDTVVALLNSHVRTSVEIERLKDRNAHLEREVCRLSDAIDTARETLENCDTYQRLGKQSSGPLRVLDDGTHTACLERRQEERADD